MGRASENGVLVLPAGAWALAPAATITSTAGQERRRERIFRRATPRTGCCGPYYLRVIGVKNSCAFRAARTWHNREMAPARTTPTPDGFPALGLSDTLIATLTALGYEEPTPVQRETIPL